MIKLYSFLGFFKQSVRTPLLVVLLNLLSPSVFGESAPRVPFSESEQQALLGHMVEVSGGDFMMGSYSINASAMEKPPHQVTLTTFFMGKTEVTQALFERVMGWNYSYFECAECPVNNISWRNALLFIERLNTMTRLEFSLPTEAQWEYAAKGGQKSQGYLYSGSNDIGEVAWYAGNAKRRSHPVAQKKPNELGLYDMTGNLWEFCLDDISRKAYQRENSINPVIIAVSSPKVKAMKVIRGGGYEFSDIESTVFKRDGATNNVRMADIGFRLTLNHNHTTHQKNAPKKK